MTKISQREARQLRKRVRELEQRERDRRAAWALNFPGGKHIRTITESFSARDIEICRRLGHAVVAVNSGNEVGFYALPLPEELK